MNRQAMRTIAASVHGVTRVENEVTVEFAPDRRDADLRRDIGSRLSWNALIDDGASITVTVTDGHVRLAGTVASAAERRRAIRDAWTDGVRSVDANGLIVEPFAREGNLRRRAVPIRSEAELRRAIDDALHYDPRVASGDITPDVNAGIVTLYGSVANLAAKRAAGADASNVVGVLHVDNRLKVEPLAKQSDAEIAADLERALARDPFLRDDDVAVTVRDGTVRLDGTVDTQFDRAQAHELAYRAAGVVRVRNDLRVE